CVTYRFLVCPLPPSLVSSFFRLPRPPRSTLFPYTTLFRSLRGTSHSTVRLHSAYGPRLSASSLSAGREARRGDPRRPRKYSARRDRKSTRLNSSHVSISYAVFCLKKKTKNENAHVGTTRRV